MASVRPYWWHHLLIITLNTNGLNSPIKRHRVVVWIKKKKIQTICFLQETHFSFQNTHRPKVKGWDNIFHTNGDQKWVGVATLISDKIAFKSNNVTRDKEGHYIMIKGSIYQEEITPVNIYAPNIGAPKY